MSRSDDTGVFGVVGWVYAIKNVTNNKLYIGKTINQPLQRWGDHLRYARKGKGTHLEKAMHKEGIENFKFTVLLRCGLDYLKIEEDRAIQQFDTVCPKGYNLYGGLYRDAHQTAI